MNSNWRQQYYRYKEYFLNVFILYKRKENIRQYLELLLTLATITIFSLFAVRPTILTILELNKEIKAKQETISKLTGKIDNLKVAQNTLISKQSEISLLNLAIPNDPQPDSLIGEVEGIATNNTVTISSASFAQMIIKGTSDQAVIDDQQIGFSFSATGDFTSLSNFLSVLDTTLRPIIVEKLIFTNGDSLIINAKSPYEI